MEHAMFKIWGLGPSEDLKTMGPTLKCGLRLNEGRVPLPFVVLRHPEGELRKEHLQREPGSGTPRRYSQPH